MRKGFLLHLWGMNFLIYEENLLFFFISVLAFCIESFVIYVLGLPICVSSSLQSLQGETSLTEGILKTPETVFLNVLKGENRFLDHRNQVWKRVDNLTQESTSHPIQTDGILFACWKCVDQLVCPSLTHNIWRCNSEILNSFPWNREPIPQGIVFSQGIDSVESLPGVLTTVVYTFGPRIGGVGVEIRGWQVGCVLPHREKKV
jgi:hypothetical protein